jgi:hypothetical protein
MLILAIELATGKLVLAVAGPLIEQNVTDQLGVRIDTTNNADIQLNHRRLYHQPKLDFTLDFIC